MMQLKSMTNVIYIKTVSPLWLDVAAYLREHAGWRPCLWVTSASPACAEFAEHFPEARLYSHRDALRALWPDAVACTSKRPVDAMVLNQLAAHESTFAAMIERWSVFAGKISWEDTRQYYLSLLRIWLRLIDSLNVGVVICPTVPHRLYDYVAHLACKASCVPYLMIDQTGEFLKTDERAWWIDFVTWTIEDRTRPFRLAAASAGPPSAAAQRYLDDGRKAYHAAKPSYFAAKEEALKRMPANRRWGDRVPPGLRLAASAAAKRFSRRGREELDRLWFTGCDDVPRLATRAMVTRHHRGLIRRAKKARAWYEAHVEPRPTDRRDYVYFAASYQPERNSIPDAGRFHDEEASIALLETIVPENWEIWYKEHPTNFRPPIRTDNTRSVVLYEKLRAISPRLRFAAMDTDPFVLIDGARAVATTTGTSGWQATVRGVPAVVLGESWYSGCSEVLRVTGPADGRAAMARVVAGWRPDFDGVRRYLAALEAVCRDLGFRRDPTVQAERHSDPARYDARIASLSQALVDGYTDWQAAGSVDDGCGSRAGGPR
jgi:hypothetical protein